MDAQNQGEAFAFPCPVGAEPLSHRFAYPHQRLRLLIIPLHIPSAAKIAHFFSTWKPVHPSIF